MRRPPTGRPRNLPPSLGPAIATRIVLTYILFVLMPLSRDAVADDFHALAALYNSTNGRYWSPHCRWPATGTPTCTSPGINCSSGRVTQINLPHCNITGTLPHQWSNMSALQEIWLHSNQLTGTLPHQWSSMSALQQVELYSNQLTGTLPPQWSGFSALQRMHLYFNQLTGTLPHQWSSLSALQGIHLSANQLTGTLPPQWSSLSALQGIYLSSNQLTGTLPPQWSNISALIYISLYINQLNGTLPHEWSSMSALQGIHLSSNQLSGTLPHQWSSMSALRQLGLYSNLLAGTLPPQWSTMSELQLMWLHSNQLSGPLPHQWSNMSALQGIYLYSNQLTGTLPHQWSSLSALQFLYLFANQFNGTLPHQWSNMSALRDMRLATNQLTGTLPHQWSSMSALEVISLSSNQLTGTLPHQWSSMSSQRGMYLYSNQLTGTLPPQWSGLSGLLYIDVNSNQLTGTVPSQWQTMQAATYTLSSIDLRKNCLNHSLAAWYTSAPYTGNVAVKPFNLAVLCNRSASTSDSQSTAPTSMLSLSYSAAQASSSVSNSAIVTVSLSLVTTASCTVSPASSASPSACTPSTLSRPFSASITGLQTTSASLSLRCDVQLCGVAVPAVSANTGSSSQHVPLLPAVDGAASMRAAPVPNAAMRDASVLALRLACGAYPLPLGIRHAVLLHNGAALDSQKSGGDVATDELLLFMPNRTLDGSSWLPAGALPFRTTNTIRIGLTISCGGDAAVVVTVPVLPEPLPALASTVAAVSGAAQWISVSGGGGVAGSLGRAAAAQRLQLCSDAGASYGGLLGVSIGDNGDAEHSYARGAVVGNVAVLAGAATVLLCVALLYGVVTGSDCRSSLVRVALPSSLHPVWVATLPTTAAALPLLLDGDIGLSLLGAAAVLLPMLLLLEVQLSAHSGRFVVTDHVAEPQRDRICVGFTLLRRSLARRWRWEEVGVSVAPSTLLRAAWVVLLDHRVPWYAALDAGVLTVTCVLSVVSGMGDVHLCRRAGWAMLALCAGQLCVCVAVRPMTSLAANVHCASCLLLTCAALLVQCVGLSGRESLPPAAATAAVALQLAVVGLSLAKLMDDAWNVARSVVGLLKDFAMRACLSQSDTANSKPKVIADASELHLMRCEESFTPAGVSLPPRLLMLNDEPSEVESYAPDGLSLPRHLMQCEESYAPAAKSLPPRRLMLFEELSQVVGTNDDLQLLESLNRRDTL